MKKRKLWRRLLCIPLIFALLFSGVDFGFFENNSSTAGVVDAYAYGGAGTNITIAGAEGPGGYVEGGYGVPKGCGWRIYLCEKVMFNEVGSTAEDFRDFLAYWRTQSVIVSDDYSGSEVKCYYKEDLFANVPVVKSITDIFKNGIDTTNFKTRWYSGTLGATNSRIKTEFDSISFFHEGGALSQYLDSNGREYVFNELKNVSGATVSESDFHNFIIVVEPVSMWQYKAEWGSCALGFQDMFEDSELTTLSTAYYNFCHSSSHNNYILGLTGKSNVDDFLRAHGTDFMTNCWVPVGGLSNQTDMVYKTSFEEKNSGFAIFGADLDPPPTKTTEKFGKASATLTVKYQGSAIDNNANFLVDRSTNFVEEANFGTVAHAAESNDIPEEAKGLRLASWGTEFISDKFNTRKAQYIGTALNQITGVDRDTWDKYEKSFTQLLTGRFSIPFADVEKGNPANLVKNVNLVATNKIIPSNYKVVSASKNVNTEDINVGKSYYLKWQNSNNSTSSLSNMTTSMVNQIANGIKYLDDSSASTSGYGDLRKIDGDISNIVYNFSASAINGTSPLKFLEHGEFNTKDDSSFDVQVSLLSEDEDVTSYIKYAVYDRGDKTVKYKTGKNRKKTYSVTSSGSFDIDLSTDNTAYCIAISANKVNAEGNGSDILGKCEGKQISSFKDFITKVSSVVPANGISCKCKVEDGETVGVGSTVSGDNPYGYVIYVLEITGTETVVKTSELVLEDYELNYVFPSMLINKETGKINTDAIIGINKKAEAKFTTTSDYKGSVISANQKFDSLAIDDKPFVTRLLLKNESVTGLFETEQIIRETGKKFTKAESPNVGASFALNLRRFAFGDNSVISAMSHTTNLGNYLPICLGLESGIKPKADKQFATEYRNSNATVGGKKTDRFVWKVDYTSNNYLDYNINYKVTEKAKKYRSNSLDTAKNTSTSSSFSTSGNTYKAMMIKSSSNTLNFYPEVKMRSYRAETNIIDSSHKITYANYFTMGERKRALKPSSMYLVRLGNSTNNISGKTVATSVGVGSNASNISGGKQVVYAGSDIALNVSSGINLKMYGYALDMIKPSDNNLLGTGTYSSVILNNQNPYEAWGNTSSSYKPLNEFNTWVSKTLSNVKADLTLKVNGSGVNKTYNNFNTSLRKPSTISAREDGVYSIRVQYGDIVTTGENSGGYQALINQIKADYACTDSQAKAIFKNSGIYQTIIDAIEDTNDAFNKSQKCSAINSTNHWYDEMVKTFVIRRYTYTHSVTGITVNDKLDYGAAPTADASTGTNQNLKTANAKWYLTLYFGSVPQGLSDGVIYNPKNYSGLSSAYNSGTVIIKEAEVKNSDFVVPSASTNDMLN